VGNREPVEREEATLMSERLKGRKVAILAEDMVDRAELVEPRKALEAEGADAQVVEAR
jgi:hypothetical protein